jgi:hypothetical protein
MGEVTFWTLTEVRSQVPLTAVICPRVTYTFKLQITLRIQVSATESDELYPLEVLQIWANHYCVTSQKSCFCGSSLVLINVTVETGDSFEVRV